ncbi:hypothetical protein BPOR_0070g00040 [Botrytis porri]|uniref:Uncharacterized protein n=2 Tax=Botrytis porri TaxID=87229 RepID=A0A4Z1L0F8_9HELO|nr:hypothetical protein BPOR_0070g00040 [Botrytis porri]
MTAPRSKGPSLKSVQQAIADGENYGDQKYSGLRIVFNQPPPPFNLPRKFTPSIGPNFAWRRATQNGKNSFDFTTPFETNLTIQATLNHFHDKMKLEKLVTQGKRKADLDAKEKMANSIRLHNTVTVASIWKLGSSQVTEVCAILSAFLSIWLRR